MNDNEMTKGITKEEVVADIRNMLSELRTTLPDSVDAISFNTKSTLPFKVMSSAGALGQRFVDLADDALLLFAQGKVVGPSILARSCLETAAIIFLVHKKMLELMERPTHNHTDDFDDFIMKILFGSKTNPDVPEAYNVLTAINHLDKRYAGIKNSYYSLSDIAHPNWPGTHGAYSELDEERFCLSFKAGNISPMQGMFLLRGSARLAQYHWQKIIDEMDKLIQLCKKED